MNHETLETVHTHTHTHTRILLNKEFLGVILLLFVVSQIFCGTICFAISNEITEVDLTGLATGQGATHTHVYEQKMDDVAHWKECFMCKNKIEYSNHTLQNVGYEGCDPYQTQGYKYCTAGCGYKKDNVRSLCEPDESASWSDRNYGEKHVIICKNCGKSGSVDNVCGLHEKDGKNIYELGHVKFTCDICHLEIDNTKHNTLYINRNCLICDKSDYSATAVLEEIDEFQVYDGEWKRFKLTITPYETMTNLKVFYIKEDSQRESDLVTYEITKEGYVGKDYVVEGKIRYDKSLYAKTWRLYFQFYVQSIDLKNQYLSYVHQFSPDRTAPEITNIETANVDDWAVSKEIKITVKEEYSQEVTISLLKDGIEIEGSEGLATNNGDGTWTRTFDSVGEVSGTQVLYAKAVDACGNSSIKAFQISNIDSQPPKLVNATNDIENWKKEQVVKFVVTDEGIGNVSIAFNDKSDYQLAHYNSVTHQYEREYRFIGNVNRLITGALYLKDGLGNETMVKIDFNQFDKTIPTVSTNVNDFQVKVIMADNLSGINSYAITNSNETPNENEWQSLDASLTASNQVLEETRTVNAGNWYYWVKDQAGNVAYSAFTIEPKQISLGSMNVTEKFQYDGSEKTPTPVVFVDGTTLIRGIDYTVSYRSNMESGVATVMVTGIGNYAGTLETQFLIYVEKTKVDVTNLITASSLTNHNCNNYAVDKYDSKNHWKECSVCSKEYIKAGRPIDASSWTKNGNLELESNSNGERILVVKGTFTNHSYENEYWTLGDSCSASNKLIHICSCGYSYETGNTRAHKEISYNYNQKVHILTCDYCKDKLDVAGEHCNENGELLNCITGISGTCKVCEKYIKVAHDFNVTYSYSKKDFYESITGNCQICGKKIVDLENTKIDILYNGNEITIKAIYAFQNELKIDTVGKPAFVLQDVGEIKDENWSYTSNEKEIEFLIKFDFLDEIEVAQIIGFYASGILANGERATMYLYVGELSAETMPPEMKDVKVTNLLDSNHWTTSLKLNVNGTENYCSSVTVAMKDKSTNQIIYTGKTAVNATTKEYALEFTPDIAADETGKEYEITVTDTLGNSTSQTIVISKVDRIAPEIVKDTQLDTENIWSTPMTWSKLKDFRITATDEGSQIARIKFQSMNHSATNYTFTDNYGITTRDENANPILNMRDYQFTGDVTGYVTATIYLVDEAGNENTEYLRIYNLDNTAPKITILNELKDGKLRGEEIQIHLKDNGSGVRYFGVTKIEETKVGDVSGTIIEATSGETLTEVTMPVVTVETDSTRGEALNTWYRVKNEAETNPNTTEAKDVIVTFAKQKTGKYRLWAKDLLGNVNYVDFEVKNEPIKLVVQHKFDREWYEQTSQINLEMSIEAEDYEFERKEDIGKDLIAKLTFTDKDGKKVKIPEGMQIMADSQKITEKNGDIYYVVQTNLKEEAFSNINQIEMDMTKIEVPEYLKVGIYPITVDFYVGKIENLAQLQSPIATYEMNLEIRKYKYYAITATVKEENKMGTEVLKIAQGEAIQRTIQLEYIGDLEEPYVTIKLQKQIGVNSNQTNQYIEIANTVTGEKCSPLEATQEIVADFKNTLEAGSYQLRFDLYDKFDSHKATENLYFEIK